MLSSPDVLDQLVRDRRLALSRPSPRRSPAGRRLRRPAPSVRVAVAGRLRGVADRLDPCPG